MRDTLLCRRLRCRKSAGYVRVVVKPDNTVDVRTVTVGATQGDVIALNSGVEPGEMLVTDGLDKLQAGTKVIVQAAASEAAGHAGDSRVGKRPHRLAPK